VGPAPPPTPLPATVFARNHRVYYEGETLYLVGEAVNGAPYPVFDVKVIATFYDAGGQLVGAQETLAALPATVPTQANPFKLALANAPAGVDRYELSLTWNDITLHTYDRVTVVSESTRTDHGVEVYGELRNDHMSEIRDIRLVVSFYDGAGAVVDLYQGSPASSSLPPGATTPYIISTGKTEIPHVSFLVQTQGVLTR
jgi:hypothetical protein